MHKADLPLEHPCPEDFDAMPRIGQDRACSRCSKVVYDLSSRTEDEAKSLYRRGVCVLYRVHRATGRVMFAGALAGSAPALAAGEIPSLVSPEPTELAPTEGEGATKPGPGPDEALIPVPVIVEPEFEMLGGPPPVYVPNPPLPPIPIPTPTGA